MPSFDSLLKPSDSRAPYYNGPDLGRVYSWTCPSCGSQVDVTLRQIQRAAWSWPAEISAPRAAELKAHFGIGPERAHGGGLISLLGRVCPGCGTSFVLYSGVDEHANSVYRVHIQGLVRVVA